MAKKIVKKSAAKKAVAAKKKPAAKAKKATPAKKAAPAEGTLDRKGLAAKARQLKTELLAVRFNVESPSLKDYRNKKKELASVLAKLG